MKIKVTKHTIEKKSTKMVSVRHSDSNTYKVPSVTLKKKDVTQTLFLWGLFMSDLKGFNQYHNTEEETEEISDSFSIHGLPRGEDLVKQIEEEYKEINLQVQITIFKSIW